MSQYEEFDEYKIKQLITDFCNKSINHIICIDLDSLCCYVGNKLNVPDAIRNIVLYRDFRNKLIDILQHTLKPYSVATLQRFEDGECDVLVLKGDGEE